MVYTNGEGHIELLLGVETMRKFNKALEEAFWNIAQYPLTPDECYKTKDIITNQQIRQMTKKQLRQEVEHLSNHIEALEFENKELSKRNDDLYVEIFSKITALKDKIKELNERSSELEGIVMAKSEENNSLRGKLSDQEKLRKDIATFMDEATDKSFRINELLRKYEPAPKRVFNIALKGGKIKSVEATLYVLEERTGFINFFYDNHGERVLVFTIDKCEVICIEVKDKAS